MSHIEEMTLTHVLELERLTKVFPGVRALDDASLFLRPGEVLALIGENGAGKSTMINCISGVLQPDNGRIRIDEKECQLTSPHDAFRNGVSVVHQERHLIHSFNVAENVFFDRICGKSFTAVNRRQMEEECEDLLQRVDLHISPMANVEELSSAQQQMIEIARALSMKSHILLLDEPTASISLGEVETLLETIRRLRDQGVAIIYVSHKLEEIFAVADRVAVLRDGKSIGNQVAVSEVTRDELIERMIGQRETRETFPSHDRSRSEPVLEVKGLPSRVGHGVNSFVLKRGEILGWYGLVGSGRTELARQVIGVDPVSGGEIRIRGKNARIPNYKTALETFGVYYLSENRKEEGLFLTHSIARNVSIVALNRVKSKLGLHSTNREEALAEEHKHRLGIKMSSPQAVVSSLSGGNQQKVCIAKCLVTEPDIIIIDEPTVGIDIRTKGEIHRLVYQLSQEGKSIILISSDLPEMIQLAERIQVFRQGLIVGELENQKEYDLVSRRIMDVMLRSTEEV